MYRVIYASRAGRDGRVPTDAELETMLVDFRMRNEENELTGLLLYFGPDVTPEPAFVQLLEGPREAVEATYARIAVDDRHEAVRLVAADDVTERLFPQWQMGLEFVTHADLARAVPELATPERPFVVMAELVSDPARAEQILREASRATR